DAAVEDHLDAALLTEQHTQRVVKLSTALRHDEQEPLHDPSCQSSVGRWWAHGRARSKAAAARSTVTSAKRRPTICSPIGSLSFVKPHGTDAAGWPVMLNGYVNGIQAYGSTGLPAISVGLSSPTGNGGAAVVGGCSRSDLPQKGLGCGPHPSPSDHHCP